MSEDLISRHAALREYQEVCNGIKCGECPFLIKVNTEKGSHLITDCKLEAFLHNLPSAQPDVPDTNVGDTISRQAAIDALGEEPLVWTREDEYEKGLHDQWHYDINALKAVPSAERHGRWEQDYQDKWRCSVCKVGNNYAYAFDAETKDYTILQDKYCPNCGAKMDEVTE